MPEKPPPLPWKLRLRHYKATVLGKIWQNHFFKKSLYNAVSWIFRKDDNFQTLNCGIIPEDGFKLDESKYPSAITHLGLELYHHMGTNSLVPFADKTILEIGCGRGGGTHYLNTTFKPKQIAGIDFSGQSIRICKRLYKSPTLEFRKEDATQLSAADNSQDIIVTIETCCCLPDKVEFFKECHRVLKPGGHLLLLDFIYQRETAEHSIYNVEKAIQQVGLSIEKLDVLTDPVFKAIQSAATIREAMIEKKCPRIFHNLAHSFAMTSKSHAFKGFAEGRTKYHFYQLKKA